MAIKKLSMFLHYQTESFWEEDERWVLRNCKLNSSGDIFVKDVEVSVDVPDNFDPRPKQVEALQERKQELEKKFNAEVTRIDTEISKLLAITYEPVL